MRFQVLPTQNNQWYFRIVARNGQVLAHSETYHNRQDALSTAQHIMEHAAGATVESPHTQHAPGQPAPGQPAPGQPAPGQPAPVNSTRMDSTPVQR